VPEPELIGSLPKIGSSIEFDIWNRLFSHDKSLKSFYSERSRYITYYSRKINSFLQVLDFIPEVRDGKGKLRQPSEFKELHFFSKDQAIAAYCCLNSTLFRWFLDVVTDGSHLNKREIDNFPIDLEKASVYSASFRVLTNRLSDCLRNTSVPKVMHYKHDTLTIQCILPKYSKHIIDEIDHLLAQYYSLNDEQQDFLVNYDIKYRMGLGSEEVDE
jgi:hypothetical protein